MNFQYKIFQILTRSDGLNSNTQSLILHPPKCPNPPTLKPSHYSIYCLAKLTVDKENTPYVQIIASRLTQSTLHPAPWIHHSSIITYNSLSLVHKKKKATYAAFFCLT